MKRETQITADGSHTIAVPGINALYHSKYGAVQEKMHVFIHTGLQPILHKFDTIHVMEAGFGAGLNALLSLREALKWKQKIFYHALELYPLAEEEFTALNYTVHIGDNALQNYFLEMHRCKWDEPISIHPLFTLRKDKVSIADFSTPQLSNLIFFDAFAPAVQPELWTKEIFCNMFSMLARNGILVTYCCKGEVRRYMMAAGFVVEKLPGPPGKKEMLRAIKK